MCLMFCLQQRKRRYKPPRPNDETLYVNVCGLLSQVLEGERSEEMTETEAEEVLHAESEERKTFTITGATVTSL